MTRTPPGPGPERHDGAADGSDSPPYGTGSLSGRIGAFGADLLAHCARDPGDVLLSPYGVAAALAMAGLGARGSTAHQLSAALRLDVNRAAVHVHHRELRQGLEERAAAGGLVLAVANRLFGAVGVPLEPAAHEELRSSYGAGLELVDFARDVERARQVINGWVACQTRQRIEELFPPGALSTDARLVLANALAFKAPFAQPFDPSATQVRPFEPAPGSWVEVPTMRQFLEVPYAEDHVLRAVELPYRGEELGLVVVLPRLRHDFPAVQRAVVERAFATPTMVRRLVDVELPRFTLSCRYELTPRLQAMGVVDAFDPKQADFSGLTGDKTLVISMVLHQTSLEVTEEGCEATAATAVGGDLAGIDAPKLIEFRADQPFLFWIRDRRSGLTLFAGRLTSPAA